MIVVLTYVDSITGISVTQTPAKNGPKLPEFDNLKVLWAKTSLYPTEVPEFVCEIASGQNISVPGVLGVLTPEQEQEAYSQELSARSVQDYEHRAKPIRTRRNELLTASDVYVIVDYPISELKLQEWKSYRQALRDVTLQSTFPDSVVWPLEPSKD